MTLRISTTSEAGQTIIKIDGRLQEGDMAEVSRVLGDATGPTALDLTDLQSVDRAAANLLRDIIAMGVELRAASPYVDLLLRVRSGPRD